MPMNLGSGQKSLMVFDTCEMRDLIISQPVGDTYFPTVGVWKHTIRLCNVQGNGLQKCLGI